MTASNAPQPFPEENPKRDEEKSDTKPEIDSGFKPSTKTPDLFIERAGGNGAEKIDQSDDGKSAPKSFSQHETPHPGKPSAKPLNGDAKMEVGPDKTKDLLQKWLKEMVGRRASDIHLRAGTPLIFRIDGNLVPYDANPVMPEVVKAALFSMIPPRMRKIFEVRSEVDFSFAVNGLGRFRGNAFKQRGSVAIVLRQIPTMIPNFTELRLPKVMNKFCQLSRGLVLVCGPTGSGKSTTLAATIEAINLDRSEHIVTIEDPIEFLYRDKKSIISQRELGTDTISFAEALKHVLRQDPDVILLGEMRDLETTSTAITAAQTGHLVFSTLHTTDAVQTINRIIDMYPPHQQQQVRLQLADVLKGVICQRLIPHASGKGRVPSSEVLVVTALVKKAIAENQMQDVADAIRQGKYYGMQTFHQSLLNLYKENQIKLEEALDAASNPEELMMAVRGITSGTDNEVTE